MLIDVKLVDESGLISTVKIVDDPSDIDLLNLLGNDGSLLTIYSIGGLDVLTTIPNRNKILIIGQAPYIESLEKKRVSCTITDEKVINIVNVIKSQFDLQNNIY